MLAWQRDAVGPGQESVTLIAYDAAGNLTTRTNPTGQILATSYDELNRVVSVLDPAQGLTEYFLISCKNLLLKRSSFLTDMALTTRKNGLKARSYRGDTTSAHAPGSISS